jgi:Domain of unknown function (DUF1905)
MEVKFTGELWFWRGPAPWYFVTVPAAESRALRSGAGHTSYGWGVLPVQARIGDTEWATSLFPKDGRYLVPVKARVRTVERLEEGDAVTVTLRVPV